MAADDLIPADHPPILEVRSLGKRFSRTGSDLAVLCDVSFALERGGTCSVVGPSGSGKTTLLGLCAGLDQASSGSVILDGVQLGSLDEDARARLRRERVGFVFQSFQLIPTLTALENVCVPAELLGRRGGRDYAQELLDRVGLADRRGHYPLQLSGGEQQRVAIARAFVNRPKLVFCDEPTGNLDAGTAARIMELITGLNREVGTAMLLVTHDLDLARSMGRIVRLRAGSVVADERVSAGVP